MLMGILKSCVVRIMVYPPVLKYRLHEIASADVLTVLNLHRIAEEDGSAYRPLAPRLFEDLLGFLKKHFQLLTFSDLACAPSAGKPKLILSFDDGYKDFIDFAVPLLEKHDVRANQNVIPACIESGLPPFNVLAQDFIGKAPETLLKELEVPGLSLRDLRGNREAIGLRISRLLKDRPMAEQEKLADRLLPQFDRFDGFRPTPMLSRAEIQQLAAIHEIGAHSYSHASMGFETGAYFRADLQKCQAYFRNQLQLPVNIYAFPNGSCRDHQVAEAQSQGVQHVLLIRNAFSRPCNSAHTRFGIYGHTRSEILFRSLGSFKRPPVPGS